MRAEHCTIHRIWVEHKTSKRMLSKVTDEQQKIHLNQSNLAPVLFLSLLKCLLYLLCCSTVGGWHIFSKLVSKHIINQMPKEHVKLSQLQAWYSCSYSHARKKGKPIENHKRSFSTSWLLYSPHRHINVIYFDGPLWFILSLSF